MPGFPTMSPHRNLRHFSSASLLFALVLGLTACGKKKEEEAAAPTPPAEAATETAQAADSGGSTTDSLPGDAPQVDVGATMTSADSALKRNDLMGATDALLKLQLSGAMKDNADAKLSHYQRMVELQKRVAEASANGDANAARAAALLRQAATTPQR